MRCHVTTAFLAATALVSCAGERAPTVTAEHAVVTLAAAAGRPGAAYFQLETNVEGTRLVRVTSPSAERIELHEEGMRPTAAFPLSPDQPLHFRPGGRHAMLFGLDPALRPGGRIALTFTFEGGPPPVTAEAEVRAPGDVPTGH